MLKSNAPTFPATVAGRTFTGRKKDKIINPATEEVIGFSPRLGVKDLDNAVDAAQNAYIKWKDTSDQERRDACNTIADVIEKHAEELAVLITKETGKTLSGMGARFEVGGAVAWSRATSQFSLDSRLIREDAGGRIELQRVPLGVCGSITPWNWPLMIAIWHIVPAIRAGNTVVLKPSPFSPLSTLRLGELVNQNLPSGVLNVVAGGNELGAAMSNHQGINKIVFTGSIETGQKIRQASAGNMKRLTLELGGNDAGIILPGTNPKPLGEGLFWGAFLNSGQTCAALKRLYVHDRDYDAVCDVLVARANSTPMGDGLDESNLLGPLQNKNQLATIESLVADARANGNRILTGGSKPPGKGYFYPITIIADASDGERVVDEEQFGPVLPIVRYTDLDQAIEKANALKYGLAASVWGQDKELAGKVADRLEAGTAYINKHAEIAPDTPFGGVKCSGDGVEFGEEGLEAYTNIKILNSAPWG